jgi:hypothetical protein
VQPNSPRTWPKTSAFGRCCSAEPLRTPNGEFIAEGVRLALPNTERVVFHLAVEAVTLAAEKQATISRRQVGVGILIGALLLWLLASGESAGDPTPVDVRLSGAWVNLRGKEVVRALRKVEPSPSRAISLSLKPDASAQASHQCGHRS